MQSVLLTTTTPKASSMASMSSSSIAWIWLWEPGKCFHKIGALRGRGLPKRPVGWLWTGSSNVFKSLFLINEVPHHGIDIPSWSLWWAIYFHLPCLRALLHGHKPKRVDKCHSMTNWGYSWAWQTAWKCLGQGTAELLGSYFQPRSRSWISKKHLLSDMSVASNSCARLLLRLHRDKDFVCLDLSKQGA